MSVPSLSLVVIKAGNIDASLIFYRALGCSFVEERHGSGPLHHSCQLGSTVFEIYPAQSGSVLDRRQPGATMLGFCVSSILETSKQLESLGASVITGIKDSPWGRHAVFADPDGRAVDVSESALALN